MTRCSALTWNATSFMASGTTSSNQTQRQLDTFIYLQRLRRCFPGAIIHSVYEAGFSGFALHRVLVQNGVENIVVNPASIEVAANDKVKTDRRDSRKLAEQLFARRL